MGLIVILSLVILSGLGYLRLRDPLYPPFIQAALWAFIITLYELFRPAVVDLPAQAYLIVVCGGVTFAAGGYWATYGFTPGKKTTKPRVIPNPVIGEILLVLSIVGLYFFAMRAVAIASEGPFDNFLVNVRYVTGGNSFVDEDPLEGFGPVAYFVSLSVVAVAVQFLLREHHGSRWRYYVSLVVACAYAILTTGRTFLMIVAVLVLGLSLLSGRISAKLGLSILVIVGSLSFAIMGFALGKVGGSGLEMVLEQFRIYLLGGLAAFGQRIQEVQALDWGTNIMRTPLLLLHYLGINVPVPDLTKEYRFVPDPTNVYTFYLPYFDDFGYLGAFVAPFAVGFLHGKVYKLAKYGSGPFMIFYALLLYPLFMQFFQDQYFSLLSTWVQYAGWTIVAFYGSRILRTRNTHTLLDNSSAADD